MQHRLGQPFETECTLSARTKSAKPADNSIQADSDQMYHGRSILSLNDDCLLHLCSFLSLHNKINLSETCTRFRGIAETMCQHEKTLTIIEEEQITSVQLRQIFLTAGHYLHNITLIDGEDPTPTLELISQYCRNLRQLRISNFPYLSPNRTAFRDIGLQLRNLTKIELSHCKIDDYVCQNLLPLQNLEYINLSRNFDVTGKYLDEFPKLVHLDLNGCLSIKSHFLNSVCEKSLLKSLKINWCPLNDDRFLDALLKLKQLEELSFNASVYYNNNKVAQMSQLESLKSLTIKNVKYLNAEFFTQLVQNKAEKLETLKLSVFNVSLETRESIYELKNLKKLYFVFDSVLCDALVLRLENLKQLKFLGLAYCLKVNAQAIVSLFEKLTEVRKLDVTGNKNITNYFIVEIADIVKKRRTKSHCTIYAGRTNVSKDIMDNEFLEEYRPFVSVSFETIYDDC